MVSRTGDLNSLAESHNAVAWDGAPSELQNRGPAFHARTYLISKVMADLRPRYLLDIGCGRGHVTAIAAKHAGRVVATDLSSAAVAETQRVLTGHPDGIALLADPLQTGLAAQQEVPRDPDVILFSEVLEHIEDDRSALRSLHRLMSADSRLVVTVPADPARWTKWDELVGHFRRYRKPELLQKFDEAGFTVEEIYSWGFPLSGWLAQRSSNMRARRLTDSSDKAEIPAALSLVLPFTDIVFRIIARIEPLLFSRRDHGSGYVVVAVQERGAR